MRKVIAEHQNSNLYRTAAIADDYVRCRNTTAMQYQKMITDITGRQRIDQLATVHRSTSNFFKIFITQLTQYLLGNGITWDNEIDLGKDFDIRLQKAVKAALCGGVSFGFWNYDHMEVLPILDFAPLYDEENGALMAGVKFWQIDKSKPLRAELYTIDGMTNYLWSKKYEPSEPWVKIDSGIYMQGREAYKQKVRQTKVDAPSVFAGENYPTFPIVPLWGNENKQSELVGLREKIDAYDFILNGWEDDLDNAQLFWIISGAGGMDDPDLLRFLDRLRTVKAAAPADGQSVQPVPVEIPVAAREQLLSRLEKQLYRDAMITNPDDLASSAATATQIRAAYERQNVKADELEYCIIDFIQGILDIAGKQGNPTFTRSTNVNTLEEVQTLTMAAAYVGNDYTARKILTLLGDGDHADEILKQMDANDAERLS